MRERERRSSKRADGVLGLKRGESRWEREKEEREEKRNNEKEKREILGN